MYILTFLFILKLKDCKEYNAGYGIHCLNCNCQKLSKFEHVRVRFEYEKPNHFLYSFNGSIKTNDHKRIAIDNSAIMLRGCKLKNTRFIYGLVCYTGHDTKIMLNSFKARSKKSKVERIMGR